MTLDVHFSINIFYTFIIKRSSLHLSNNFFHKKFQHFDVQHLLMSTFFDVFFCFVEFHGIVCLFRRLVRWIVNIRSIMFKIFFNFFSIFFLNYLFPAPKAPADLLIAVCLVKIFYFFTCMFHSSWYLMQSGLVFPRAPQGLADLISVCLSNLFFFFF